MSGTMRDMAAPETENRAKQRWDELAVRSGPESGLSRSAVVRIKRAASGDLTATTNVAATANQR